MSSNTETLNYFSKTYLNIEPKILSERSDEVTISSNGVKARDLATKIGHYITGMGNGVVTVKFQGLVIRIDTKI